MADFCALCGAALPRFRKKSLVCCGENQDFCLTCYEQVSPIDHVARTRILLEKGRAAVNPEAMEKVLRRIDDKAETRRRENATDLKCIRCGAPMEKLGRRWFQLGTENLFFDTHAFSGSLELDVVRCSGCQKVEFFACDPLPSPEEHFITCPTCGARHDPKVSCPRCAMNNASDRISTAPRAERKPKPGEKPPWEK